jgi:hypothetical protein
LTADAGLYAGTDKDEPAVGCKLGKLAANIGIGRNIAGVHWRSDHAASIALGEQVAIARFAARCPTRTPISSSASPRRTLDPSGSVRR